jgi:pimeloyl-ACP methyl ester carboxylesterase
LAEAGHRRLRPVSISARAIRVDEIVTIDRAVPHSSTVPANVGQAVSLALREKIAATTQRDLERSRPEVVLFIHGGFAPAVVAYDLPYRDYSIMAVLAAAGFDVFAMEHTGYGCSPKPTMDDPCNVDPAFQHLLIPHVLKEPCRPSYPYKLVSSRTELDEIETVVRYIMHLRQVDRISLFGWSTGAPRAGGFAALHPDKVDKLVLVAPAPFFPSETPPEPMPEPGAPMILQSYERLMVERWQNDVHCDDQIDDPDVRDVFWRELMAQDGLGAEWTADGRGIMRAPNRMNFGWRTNAAKISAPTLVVQSELDNYANRRDAWNGLGATDKLFVKIACASHFLQFEKARHVLHRVTREWLQDTAVAGFTRGELYADAEGSIGELRPMH